MKPDWLHSLQLPPNERRVHVPGGLGGATLQRNLCPRFLRRRLPGALLVRQRWRVPRRHRTLSVHARIHGQQPAVASSQPHSCDVANDPSTLHFWGQFCLVVYRANFLTCLGSIKVGKPCSSSYWLWPPPLPTPTPQGVHCESPCKSGTYGKNCSLECSCKNFVDCSPIDGACFCKEGKAFPFPHIQSMNHEICHHHSHFFFYVFRLARARLLASLLGGNLGPRMQRYLSVRQRGEM